jgi:hypothetical protein
MKKQISKLILLMVPIMLLFSCNKDKFTEKDALDAQQKIDLLITVVDASSLNAPVEGASVILINDTATVARKTNSYGIVVFPNTQIGDQVAVSVSKTDFTTVLATVATNPPNYRQTQVSSVISVYSLESTKIATVRGRLTVQSDLTDRNREPAVGFTVKARNSALNSTNQLFTAITDADGKYSIAVPVTSNGDDIFVIYPDFTVSQTLALTQGNSTAVVDRSVLYKPSTQPTGDLQNIPSIPSVFATIASPPTSSGSGFALGSKANRVPFSSNYSSYSLIDGGAGYNGGVSLSGALLSFSTDPNGVSSKLSVNLTNGKITSIVGFIDNGATYAAPPTLNLNSLSPTTPAIIAFNFQTTYKIYIANRGTNYVISPLVSAETEYYSAGTKVKAVDPNINDASTVNLGTSNILTNYTTIYGGIIKSTTANADTILNATSAFSSAPVFTVVSAPTRPAVLSITTANINADSTIASISVTSSGAGYNPSAPPAVVLTTLKGFGQGAVAKATVTTSGAISTIFITNPGSKYVRNINDYSNTGVTFSTHDDPSSPITSFYDVKPGDEVVNDVYYGTGYQLLNQSSK